MKVTGVAGATGERAIDPGARREGAEPGGYDAGFGSFRERGPAARSFRRAVGPSTCGSTRGLGSFSGPFPSLHKDEKISHLAGCGHPRAVLDALTDRGAPEAFTAREGARVE